MEMRVCRTCHLKKPRPEFWYKENSSKYILHATCKVCYKKKIRRRYIKYRKINSKTYIDIIYKNSVNRIKKTHEKVRIRKENERQKKLQWFYDIKEKQSRRYISRSMNIPLKDIPEEFISAKLIHLKLVRELRNKTFPRS